VSDRLGVFTNLAAYFDWINSISNPPVIQLSNIYQCDKKAPCGCGQTDVNITVSGVIGSDDVVEYSWPMIVSIRRYDTHLCTGSILSDSFILTSADCIYYYNNSDLLTIIIDIPGTVPVLRQVDKVYIHPNYSRYELYSHDIAIIHLDQPLTLDNRSSTYTKTCVPNESKLSTDSYPKPNSLLAVIGFDRDESDSRMLYTLKQISVTMLESEHQSCSLFRLNSTYQFCAKPSNNNSRRISYLCRGKDNR
jgi:secreted trypsin-like serine protease